MLAWQAYLLIDLDLNNLKKVNNIIIFIYLKIWENRFIFINNRIVLLSTLSGLNENTKGFVAWFEKQIFFILP